LNDPPNFRDRLTALGRGASENLIEGELVERRRKVLGLETIDRRVTPTDQWAVAVL
jgi:hypothetical protein